MRLLVVSQYFWPETFRVNDLVDELVRRGHQVTVLTGTPNYPEGRTFPAFLKDPQLFTSFAGAEVLRIPLAPRGKGRVRLVLNYLTFVVSGLTVGLWRLRGRGFDAIFVFQTSPITSALPALALRRLKRAPLLMWVLDLWPESLAAVGAVRSQRLLRWMGKLVAFIYRRCDRILVQSRAFVANVEKYSGDTSRIRYFPGWAEPIFDGTLADVPLAPEVVPFRDTFNILFAGNIGDAQDFPAILDAADALRDERGLRWLIVGDGRAADWVRSEVARRKLEQSVVMLGRHPIERMPAFFRAANALLVSLKKDPVFALTIPGKVQSYLATGLPIVAMLDGEGAAVISQAGAGLVCPAGSSEPLARHVRLLMTLSANALASMGERGRRYCEQEFSRATLVSALETWTNELIHGQTPWPPRRDTQPPA
jgi:glycosyltransferase involved in cell wall biosynthesis